MGGSENRKKEKETDTPWLMRVQKKRRVYTGRWKDLPFENEQLRLL